MSERGNPAGFGRRAIAFLIDNVLFWLPCLLIVLFIFEATYQSGSFNRLYFDESLFWAGLAFLLYMIPAAIVGWLYFAILEASGWQGTLGKKLLGIKVVDSAGGHIGFGNATVRYFSKILSAAPVYVGFLVAIASDEGLTWHDRIADTRVVMA